MEIAEADLLGEEEPMRRALSGCDALFHVGALYAYWPPDHNLAYRTNVEGTRKILSAAGKAGVKRAVHTSSSAAIGLPRDGSPGTEETPVDTRVLLAGYKRSKYLSELEALKAGMNGLETVIVNPTTPVGPGDVKPTPTGRIIVDFLKQRMFGYLETGPQPRPRGRRRERARPGLPEGQARTPLHPRQPEHDAARDLSDPGPHHRPEAAEGPHPLLAGLGLFPMRTR